MAVFFKDLSIRKEIPIFPGLVEKDSNKCYLTDSMFILKVYKILGNNAAQGFFHGFVARWQQKSIFRTEFSFRFHGGKVEMKPVYVSLA